VRLETVRDLRNPATIYHKTDELPALEAQVDCLQLLVVELLQTNENLRQELAMLIETNGPSAPAIRPR